MAFNPFSSSDSFTMATFNNAFNAMFASDQNLTNGEKEQARSNIGAAPDGFGLGDFHGLVITANTEGGLNAAVKCGWYYFGGDTPVENAPIGVVNSNYGYLLVCSRDYNNACTQFAFFETQDNIAIRHQIGTTWGPWEWVNPPMNLGIEYRTTERYLRKPVYIRVVDCGAMPAPGAGYKQVQIPYNGDTNYIDNANICANNITYWGLVLPTYDSNNLVTASIMVNASGLITLTSASGSTNLSGNGNVYVTVKYTKTTD